MGRRGRGKNRPPRSHRLYFAVRTSIMKEFVIIWLKLYVTFLPSRCVVTAPQMHDMIGTLCKLASDLVKDDVGRVVLECTTWSERCASWRAIWSRTTWAGSCSMLPSPGPVPTTASPSSRPSTILTSQSVKNLLPPSKRWELTRVTIPRSTPLA